MSAEGVGMAVGDNTEDREGRFLWVVGRQEFEDKGLYKMKREEWQWTEALDNYNYRTQPNERIKPQGVRESSLFLFY